MFVGVGKKKKRKKNNGKNEIVRLYSGEQRLGLKA